MNVGLKHTGSPFYSCDVCRRIECVCLKQSRLNLDKAIRILLTVLTLISGALTVWLYRRRTTFDEPLFFIAEILFNLPLLASFTAFLFLSGATINSWIKHWLND